MDERICLSILNNVPVYLPEPGKIKQWLLGENQMFEANQKIAEAVCNEQVVEIKTIEKGIIKKILVSSGTVVESNEIAIALLEFQLLPSKVVQNFLQNTRKTMIFQKKSDDGSLLVTSLDELQKKRKEIEEILSHTKESNYSLYYIEIINEIDEQLLYHRKLLLELYRKLKLTSLSKYEKNGYKPFYLSRSDECKLTQIPYLKLSKKSRKNPLKSLLLYTNLNQLEKFHTFSPFFAAQSTSTYPYIEAKKQREGDPICDQYRVLLSNNATILTMADGCNWGRAPENAAYIASHAFIQYLQKNLDLLISTISTAHVCLRGITYAHNAIISQSISEGFSIGTTTLLGGVIARVILPSRTRSRSKRSHNKSRSKSTSPSAIRNISISPREDHLSSYSSNNNNNGGNNSSGGEEKTKSPKVPKNTRSVPTTLPVTSASSSSLFKPNKSPPTKLSKSPPKIDLLDFKTEPPLPSNDLNVTNTTTSSSNNNATTDDNAVADQISRSERSDSSSSEDVNKSSELLERRKDFVFVFASVGDCKAFRWVKRSRNIEELTPESRKESADDATDCGGRIGPYVEGGPDLRNLEVYLSACEEGDIIFICSDGVHDNFDPQMLGFSPSQFGLTFENWGDGDSSMVNLVKSEYRTKLMKKILYFHTNLESDLSNDFYVVDDEMMFPADLPEPTPHTLVARFIDYCKKVTKASQQFMQNFPGKRLPSNYKEFPGKMDHSTILAYQVGEISWKNSTSEIAKNPLGCVFTGSEDKVALQKQQNSNDDKRRLFLRQDGAYFNGKIKSANKNSEKRKLSRSLSPPSSELLESAPMKLFFELSIDCTNELRQLMVQFSAGSVKASNIYHSTDIFLSHLRTLDKNCKAGKRNYIISSEGDSDKEQLVAKEVDLLNNLMAEIEKLKNFTSKEENHKNVNEIETIINGIFEFISQVGYLYSKERKPIPKLGTGVVRSFG